MSAGASPASEVLVVGEALVDIVVTPEGTVAHPGGSPANVALGLGRLGLDVGLLTTLGPDERGRGIERHLRESGVEVLPSSFSATRTSTAVATIGADGSARYEFDVAWDLPGRLEVGSPRLVHTGSIAAFLEPGATAVRGYLASVGAEQVTFDPNIRPALVGSREAAVAAFEEATALATTVKLSDEDAEWLYPGAELDTVLRRVLTLGPRLAVLTLGARGSRLATPSFTIDVPPVRVEVVDTIGAGDTYMASLIASLLASGAELTPEVVGGAGRRAARAAALTVSRAGADLPWRHELEDGADPSRA
jgi:fructokinase